MLATYALVSLVGVLHLKLAGANPVAAPPSAPTADAALLPPIFVCDDNDLAKKCVGDPYHYRCTNDKYPNYDVPYPPCSDWTRCSCEFPCTNPKIC
ncbi:hypothetical protein C8A01DRAFT_41821 [Parachaetomium inaequale]|uniref:Uncharacterized protein n=1 Tax=Parachaetomium inaequale TaxID=2588326 RepID=A0AAN6P6J4_9PEZI|nr:hypothetical protein C8A01DRAFT_41821 [Parachaetomium inaequale]